MDTPTSVRFSDLVGITSLSPAMYQQLRSPRGGGQILRSFLDEAQPYSVGIEPGTAAYVDGSPWRMFRNSALTDLQFTPAPNGRQGLVGVKRQSFPKSGLAAGDVLLAKDSNVGACAMLGQGDWSRTTHSSGSVRLSFRSFRSYAFAWMRHPYFRAQLTLGTPRGSTLAHASDSFLNCLIPLPLAGMEGEIVGKVESAIERLVSIEDDLRSRYEDCVNTVARIVAPSGGAGATAESAQTVSHSRVAKTGRLDTGLYSGPRRTLENHLKSYPNGYATAEELGFELARGQNLQQSAVGTSIYASEPRPGYYRLILPTHISEFGIVTESAWIGNRNRLSTVDEGDVLFGAEGTFRTAVLYDLDEEPTVTNIHGILVKTNRGLPWQLAVAAWLQYLDRTGVLKAVAVGGHGGSAALAYWDQIPFPVFADDDLAAIAALHDSTVDSRSSETAPGIRQLAAERLALSSVLTGLLDTIFEGDEESSS